MWPDTPGVPGVAQAPHRHVAQLRVIDSQTCDNLFNLFQLLCVPRLARMPSETRSHGLQVVKLIVTGPKPRYRGPQALALLVPHASPAPEGSQRPFLLH